jgi:Xaa-Pro aminopeptidase
MVQYQAAAIIVGSYLARGCERSAYTPIVASGPSATTLHYSSNRRRMMAGDLVLIDAGAECSSYAADLTRTLPVSGSSPPA